MALPDVLDADQVLVNGGALSNVRFKISGGVQVRLISIFPGKIVTGDYTRANDQLLSTHVWNDFRGGMLVKRMDPTTQADRSYRPQLDTRFPKQTPVLPAITAHTSGIPAGTNASSQAIIHGNILYAGFHGSLGVAAAIREFSASNQWAAPTGIAAGPLGGTWTDRCSLRMGSTDWLVFAHGAGYVQWDGTTGTAVTGNDTTIPNATYLTQWDQRLWALTATQNKLWVTSDLSTWTAKAVVPEAVGEVVRLITTYTNDGDEIIHALTKRALWLYDATNDKWYRTAFTWPRHPYAGLGVAHWQGQLYVSVGTSMYAYDGRVVRSLGLDREDGLPEQFQGYINGLVDGFRWLYASTTGLGGTNLGSIFAYDGVGWHVMRVPSSNTAGLMTYGAHRVFGVTEGGTYLWWHEGGGGTPLLMSFPVGSVNPVENTSYTFQTGTGSVDTPWFDANWQEVGKLAVTVRLSIENASATNTWALYYAIDDNENYTTAGMTALATGQTSTTATLQFASGAGIEFKRIRFKLVLTQAAATHPPVLMRFLALSYLINRDPLYGYNFTVVAPRDQGGDTVPQQFANLQTLIDTDTLVEFKFLKDGQEIVTRRVKGTAFQASRYPGDDGRFRASISVSEIA